MGEIGLDALGVVEPAPDPAPVRSADDQGHGVLAVGAVVHARRFAHHLVEGREDEVGELYLHHRAHAVHGRPDGHAHNAGLGQWGVDDSARAELLNQAFGDPEHAAVEANILTDEEHAGVRLKFFAEAVPHSFDQPHLTHHGA